MRRLVLLCFLVLGLGTGLLVAWLGPGPLLWSAKAAVSPASDDSAWSHVPAGAPGLAACELGLLLESPVGRGLRPELEALAALEGADLSWFEERLDQVLIVHDGEATTYALGRPLALSPLLLARLDERWAVIEGDGHRGASDGLLALFPLEPGLVLATEASAAGQALQLAHPGGARAQALPLEGPGQALRARLTITPRLRARARRLADPRLLPLVEALSVAELELTALDELDALLSLSCRDEPSAAATEDLLRQLDSAASMSRQAGGLAIALLGEAGRLLSELPPLEIAREGSVVRVRAIAGPQELRPWLRRALDARVKNR